MAREFSPIRDRLKTYRKVREIIEVEGYTGIAGLAKELTAAGCVLPSRETIRRWALGRSSPFSGKRIFEPKPSEELSFFLGAWIGDGWADENDGGKRMLLKVRSYDFAKEYADCAARILGKTDSYWVRRVVDNRGKWYLVKVTSFTLYDFVNQPFRNLRAIVKQFPKGFLRGVFTAEGNPATYIQRGARPRLCFGLCVSNTDFDLLKFVRDLLLASGYRPGRFKIDRLKGEATNISIATRTLWQINLSRRDDAERFVEAIGFADSEKQRKLEDAIALVRQYGSFGAATRWPMLYEKKKGYWTRRACIN